MKNLESNKTKFPWAYSIGVFACVLSIGIAFTLPYLFRPEELMGPSMVISLFIEALLLSLIIWGFVLLAFKRHKEYPALRWLILIPFLILILGLIISLFPMETVLVH